MPETVSDGQPEFGPGIESVSIAVRFTNGLTRRVEFFDVGMTFQNEPDVIDLDATLDRGWVTWKPNDWTKLIVWGRMQPGETTGDDT